jgi:hypothetical protein
MKRKVDSLPAWFYDWRDGKTFGYGRATKPYLKNVNIEKVPTEWKSNKKASMTSHIMEEWLGTFNAKMKEQKHSALLFLDSKTCHPHTACPLPQHHSVSQSMNQKVIKCVKLNYFKLLMQSLPVD